MWHCSILLTMQSLWLESQDFWDCPLSSSLRKPSFLLHLLADWTPFRTSLPLLEAPVVSRVGPTSQYFRLCGMTRTCLASAKTLKNGWALLSEDSYFLLTALSDFSNNSCSFLRAYFNHKLTYNQGGLYDNARLVLPLDH